MKQASNPASADRPLKSVAVRLEAPVVLTPDQIQQIAAGLSLPTKDKLVPVTRLGIWPILSLPTIPGPIFNV